MEINHDKGKTVGESLGLDLNFMKDLDDKFTDAVHYSIGVELKTEIVEYVLNNFSYNELVIIATKYIDEVSVDYINNNL